MFHIIFIVENRNEFLLMSDVMIKSKSVEH